MSLFSKAKSILSKTKRTVLNGLESLGSVFERRKKDDEPTQEEEIGEDKLYENEIYEDDPVLDEEDFKNSRDLDDLNSRYSEKDRGEQGLSQLYEQAQKDWWKLKSDYEPEIYTEDYRPGDLPHDSYKLELGPNGYFRMDLNVVGIAHGQEYFAKMSDDVRDYLRDEIEDISEDSKVYMEDGFDSTVFDTYFEDSYNVEELDDRKLLGITEDREPGLVGKYLQKYFAGPIIDTVYNLKRRSASEEGGRNQVMSASMDALDKPENIPQLQQYVKAHTLPYRFRKDFFEKRRDSLMEREEFLENQIERREDYEPEGVKDSLRNSYELGILKAGLKKVRGEKKYQGAHEVIGLERSKYMLHEAVRRGYEEREGEIWLVAGAAHQADIEQYLEEYGLENIEKAVTLQDFTSKYAVSD